MALAAPNTWEAGSQSSSSSEGLANIPESPKDGVNIRFLKAMVSGILFVLGFRTTALDPCCVCVQSLGRLLEGPGLLISGLTSALPVITPKTLRTHILWLLGPSTIDKKGFLRVRATAILTPNDPRSQC